LAARIESYRGGYSADARRSIEERFFRGDLWGVGEQNHVHDMCCKLQILINHLTTQVATNAFELGVDIGDIDLTLHCGYPGSRSSLLQQAGRSGRGTGMPSCAILISFSSPSEQYLWKVPRNIFNNGVNVTPSLPTIGTVLQGHLLCAGEEFPLTGNQPVACILNETPEKGVYCPPDALIFGSPEAYNEGVDNLTQKSLLRTKTVCAMSNKEVEHVVCKETHPVSIPTQRSCRNDASNTICPFCT
jgi:DEAD/DEAH box helicase domain-containing protein